MPLQRLTEQQRDLAARHVRLVYEEAARSYRRWSTLEERVGWGWFGLIRAAVGYDPGRCPVFEVYARVAIRREIRAARRGHRESLLQWLPVGKYGPTWVDDPWALATLESRHDSHGRLDRSERIRFQRAVQSLPDRQRRAVRLRYIKGLRLKVVARELGVSTGCAGRLIQDGLRRLSTSRSLAELAAS